MKLAARCLLRDKKGMEVQQLVMLIILVVFLALAIGAIILMWSEGNIFGGEGSICQQTGWALGGCS